MELSMRSFLRENKDGGVLLLRFEGATLMVDNPEIRAFYESVERENEKAEKILTEKEKSAYAALKTAKEKYAYRPLVFLFAYEILQKEKTIEVRRRTEFLRKGKTICSFSDTDEWNFDGYLDMKKERKRKQKLSNPLIFLKNCFFSPKKQSALFHQ